MKSLPIAGFGFAWRDWNWVGFVNGAAKRALDLIFLFHLVANLSQLDERAQKQKRSSRQNLLAKGREDRKSTARLDW